MHAQVPQPVRRDGGGPAAAAVLRLQHRALLLGGVPESRLARGPQGRMPAPARARLTGAAAWPSRVTGNGRQLLCMPVHGVCLHDSLCSPLASDLCRWAGAQQRAPHNEQRPARCAWKVWWGSAHRRWCRMAAGPLLRQRPIL